MNGRSSSPCPPRNLSSRLKPVGVSFAALYRYFGAAPRLISRRHCPETSTNSPRLYTPAPISLSIIPCAAPASSMNALAYRVLAFRCGAGEVNSANARRLDMSLASLLHRAGISVVAALALLLVTPEARATKTLENMQTAFNGESNAHAKYLAFAQQADKEGYLNAANLFRAAARAEQIHASNHAEVIRKLGAEPKATVEAPDVKSTRENLETALKGESYERDTMYPEFVKQAKADRDLKALRSLSLAKTAEAEHAKLYKEALAGLDTSKGVAAKGYYVCPVCGFTTRVMDFKNCPSCFTEKHRFETVA